MSEASWAGIIGLNGDDEALFAAIAGDEAEAMFFTAGGKAIRFATNQVNPQATPSARGVIGIKLGKGDSIVAGTVVEPGDGVHSVIVSQAGFAKRVPLDEFPVQGRGGQGVQSLKITKATGKVAAATVGPVESRYLDVLSAKGLRQRLALDDLPLTNRPNRGEMLVDFGPDDAIVGATVLRGS
jgi:DNA gyrase subunit A